MKAVILIIFFVVLAASKFQLFIFQPDDCNCCKFVVRQIRSLIAEYHWENALKLRVIECSKRVHLCRDSVNRPLLLMFNDKKEKLNQVGGVHSKLYFRDWIANYVEKNPLEIEVLKNESDKYQRLTIKNIEMVGEFYRNKVERLEKIQKDKLESINNQFNKEDLAKKQILLTTKPGKNYGNFLDELRKLAVIAVPILFVAIMAGLVLSRFRGRRRRRYTIPIHQNELD